MKLLFLYYVPSGGMETLNRERCRSLERRGVECHLLYLRQGGGLQNLEGIPTYVMDDDDGLRALLQRERYDAIVLSSFYLILYRLRQLGYDGLLVFEVQGLGGYADARTTLTDALPHINNHADALLYPNTPHLISLFRELYPVKRHYCFDNCLDTAQFRYRPSDVPPAPVMGWVGRIEPNKNWRLWLEIASRVIERIPRLVLWLFEDADLSPEKMLFNERVNQLELEPRLVRRSNVPHRQMADYYSMIGDSGGFLISTSVVEGFGYAVVEAMSCRCPVITSDSDDVRSFVVHNETGKLFAQGDKEGAVREVYDIVYNRQLREQIRDRAERRAQEQFAPERYASRFLAMLGELGLTI